LSQELFATRPHENFSRSTTKKDLTFLAFALIIWRAAFTSIFDFALWRGRAKIFSDYVKKRLDIPRKPC